MAKLLQNEIEKLKKKLLALSSIVEGSLEKAIRSVTDRNQALAVEVIENDEIIDAEEVEVEAPWGATLIGPPLASRPKLAYSADENRACFGHQRAREILCVDDDGVRNGVRWVDDARPVAPSDPAILRWRSATMTEFGDKVGAQVAVIKLLKLDIEPLGRCAEIISIMKREARLDWRSRCLRSVQFRILLKIPVW